jgi:hypothetical protein
VIALLNTDPVIDALHFGAASSDRVTLPVITGLTKWTACFLARFTGTLAANLGLFSGPSDNTGFNNSFARLNGTTGDLLVRWFRSTSSAQCVTNDTPFADKGWKIVMIVNDTSAAQVCRVFWAPIGGTLKEASYAPTPQNGSGTFGTDSGSTVGPTWGNAAQTSPTLAWRGDISLAFFWGNQALTLDEGRDFFTNPARIPRETALYSGFYLGQFGTKVHHDLSGRKNFGTVTGATLIDGPPIGTAAVLHNTNRFDDAWQSLDRIERIPPTPPASGTNITLDVGALTLAGFAPTVSLSNNQNVAAGLGALSLAGFAPTVSVSNNQNVVAGLGALSATGFAPTVATPQNVGAGVGALSLAGFAPTVSAGTTIPLGVGALSLTGFAPTITVSNHQNVLAGVGVLVASGFAPSVATPRNALAGTGALLATGFAPVVFASNALNVPLGTGAIAFAGFAPAYSSGPAVTLGPGPFTVRARGLNTRTIARLANTTVAVRGGANTTVTPREN